MNQRVFILSKSSEKRMKKIIFSFLSLVAIVAIHAQTSIETCNLGFSFEISSNSNWGEHEPVIRSIVPGSPAAKAGLKINDIIMEVNGKGTYLKPYSTIMSWFSENEREMQIGVRNLGRPFRRMTIKKNCRVKNAISEAQLAPVFAFYSLEDVQERRFVIPVKTTTNPNAQFSDYLTFDFARGNDRTAPIDARINAIFEKVLTERGLKRDTTDPDFIIQTYYSYQHNPAYNPNSPTLGTYRPTWRFDMRNKRMIKIPVYSPSEAVRVNDIMYTLEFGYRFYDRKFMQPGEMVLIWESEVSERLSANYGLENYLEMNLPLILLKFPYPENLSSATYQVNHLKYNYTGINYNMDDLKTIVSVDPDSPAEKAGIQAGDVVKRIQNHPFNHDPKSLTESYRRFIAETMKYRDESTRYTDVNGFDKCMFWNIAHYNEIAKTFENKRYKAAFSYLFNFNQYVDWETPDILTIVIDRKGKNFTFRVVPEIVTFTTILAY